MAAAKAPKELYTRFVEIGRVVLVQYGPEAGKLATIVDVVDQTRALIDSPSTPGIESTTGFGRQVVAMKWLALTDYKVKVTRNAKQKSILKAWAEQDTAKLWLASGWGKKMTGKVDKAKMTDMQRFEAQLKAQATSLKIKKALKQ